MPGVARCKECGQEIWWHRSRNGRTYPPMVKTHEQVLVLIDDVMHTTTRWERHECRPEDVSAYVAERMAEIEHQEAEKERRAQHEVHMAAAVEFARVTYQLALRYDCPKCGVEEGEGCENLTKRRSGQQAYTAWPHMERYHLIPERERPYWVSHTEFHVPPKEE